MEGLILGLSSGASCFASCAPFLIPALAVEGGSGRLRRLGLLGLFLAGRFLAYAAVGLAIGSLGAIASGYLAPATDRILLRSGWALGGFALLAGGLSGLEGPAICSRLGMGRGSRLGARLGGRPRPGLSVFILGLAAGLNLCPPFIAAAGRVVELGPLGGLGYFVLFFLGTSVWALLLGALPTLRRRAGELRKIARITMVLLGSYFLVALGVLGWS